jgi:hypothetical protein
MTATTDPAMTLNMPDFHDSSHASTPHERRSIPPAGAQFERSRSTLRIWEPVDPDGESYEEDRTEEQRNEPKVGEREGVKVRRERVKVRRRVRRRSANVETAKTRCREELC